MSMFSAALNKLGVPKSVTSAGTALLRTAAATVPGGKLLESAGQAFDSLNKGKSLSTLAAETRGNVQTAVTAGQIALDAGQSYDQASAGARMFLSSPVGLLVVLVLAFLVIRGK